MNEAVSIVSALVSFLMLVIVLIKLRGSGNGQRGSVLSEGERNALYGTSADVREMRSVQVKMAEALELQTRSLDRLVYMFTSDEWLDQFRQNPRR